MADNNRNTPARQPAGGIMDWEPLVTAIPDADSQEGEGMDRILTQLYGAQSAADLNAPWDARGFEAYAGQTLTLQALTKRPSEYPGPIPFYVIARGHVTGTGEAVTITTGAVSVIAQLSKAWAAGFFPVTVVPVVVESKTKKGQASQHLRFVTKPDQGQA